MITHLTTNDTASIGDLPSSRTLAKAKREERPQPIVAIGLFLN